jgi:hypothetical protein
MRRLKFRLAIYAALCGIVLCGGARTTSAQAVVPLSVEAEATEFKALLSDGRMLRSRDLVGATLVIAIQGKGVRVRIDAVERDPDARNGTVWLHTFSAQTSDGSWQNLCGPGPDGRRQGFPIAGRPRSDGMMEDAEPGVFELVCTSGGQGKCVRFGYLPWRAADGSSLRDLYNACVRMVRADYCGNGTPTTRDGMQIDIYDDKGIQRPDNVPAMDFEAGWTPQGATCVRHVRVKENVSLESLVAACPRLKDKIGPMCEEETARGLGAKLFNRSRP